MLFRSAHGDTREHEQGVRLGERHVQTAVYRPIREAPPEQTHPAKMMAQARTIFAKTTVGAKAIERITFRPVFIPSRRLLMKMTLKQYAQANPPIKASRQLQGFPILIPNQIELPKYATATMTDGRKSQTSRRNVGMSSVFMTESRIPNNTGKTNPVSHPAG